MTDRPSRKTIDRLGDELRQPGDPAAEALRGLAGWREVHESVLAQVESIARFTSW